MDLAVIRSGPDLSALDDAALVRLARHGEEGAVRTLVRRHNRRLFRVARSIVSDDAEAEDVVQEAYVRAFTSLGTFRGDAQFATWLTRIALNEALGRVRRNRPAADLAELDAVADRQGSLVMFPMTPVPANPEAELARSEVRRLLEEAVDRLPEIFRTVFVLRDVEGLSVEETAAQLSIRAETVKTRLHRARRLMRAAIAERLVASLGDLFPFDGDRCAGVADRVIERLRAEGRISG